MVYFGYPFVAVDEALKLQVWSKGVVVPGQDPAVHRKDVCGNWMRYDQHGKEGEYGWEIDHILPRARGGTTVIANLQPLWWRNNRSKGDTYPWFPR
ncbi:MAG: hypothetical protein A4S17_04015 [Proteobacteria bacterium HN_bin10]|jgi:5-methylcytosine-specific restriction endonuclease McrA|nr:MAG: hypothetical protein A4S17_04015 [Proteobacteria bacterium HN_bin10]